MASVRQSMWFSFLTESWPKAITRKGSALPWASSAFFYKVPCAFWPWFDLCEGQTWPELCHTKVGKMSLLAYWVVVLWMLGVNLVSQTVTFCCCQRKRFCIFFVTSLCTARRLTPRALYRRPFLKTSAVACTPSPVQVPALSQRAVRQGLVGPPLWLQGALGSVQQTGL